MPIFISQDLWLSGDLEDGYINANNPRIGYHNLVVYGGITAESENPIYPAVNIANPATNLWWESESDLEQHIEFNFNLATWNYFAIAGHNLSGAIYQVQTRSDPMDAWEDVTDEFSPGDNSAIMHLFENVISPYARLKIIPAAGVNPKIAVIYIGEYLTLTGRTYVGHRPINYARKSDVVSGMSEYGDFLGRVVRRTQLANTMTQKNVPPAYYRSYIEPFAVHAITKPFFIAWRPGEYPDEIGFCWATDNIIMENEKANGHVMFDINMIGLAPWPEETAPAEGSSS